MRVSARSVWRKEWFGLGLAVLLIGAAAASLAVFRGMRHEGEIAQVREQAGFDDMDCERVLTREPYAPLAARWPDARKTALIGCEGPGPTLEYARFADVAAANAAIRRSEPRVSYCVDGARVALDGFFDRNFDVLCERWSGHLIRKPAPTS